MPTLTDRRAPRLPGRPPGAPSRTASAPPAAAPAGRASAVTLVAVTKYGRPPTVAALLPELGVLDLGESRPQELWHKAGRLPPAVRWHLVGHLQRNKIERTLPLVHLIHSVDSLRLLDALDAGGRTQGRPLDVLLEVNASREANKHGFAPEEVPGLAPRLGDAARRPGPRADDDGRPERRPRALPADVRRAAAAARPAAAAARRRRTLEHLSMGMSNDFEVAIEEGATLVRIGTRPVRGHARRRHDR